MKRKYVFPLFFALLALLPSVMMAVPAYPVRKMATLKDGSKVELTLTGDEHFHYYRAADGRAFQLLDDNQFQQISASEWQQLSDQAEQSVKQANMRRAKRSVGKPVGNLTGTKKGLVILVRFADNDFSVEDPLTYFTNQFNKKGFSENGMSGSVSDYFSEQSYGVFNLEFDVVGPYKLSKAMGSYGAHNGNANDTDPQGMVAEAVKLANSEVNYADYDWDKDGVVDQVFVIYAGRGENYGANKNTIWPHESTLESFNITLDGKKLATYGCSCELRGDDNSPAIPDGIGSACHEFSHCLGLPDMYDTNYSGNYGTSIWDLMNQGSYNNNSCTPAGFTAYERMFCNWLQPTVLNSEQQISGMKSLATTPEAYILFNEGNHNEYYLLENRQKVGFDAALYGHGLLVTHITYDESYWFNNKVNSGTIQRCVVVPADNAYTQSYDGIANDVFPGGKKVTSLTNRTAPMASLNFPNSDGSYLLNKSIERITESDGTISFLACRPDLGVPQVGLQKLSDTSFRAQWPAVSGATGYEIQLEEYPTKSDAAEAILFDETFEKCFAKTNGFSDISGKLDQYTDKPGFTGSKLFLGKSGLLVGTSKDQGELSTPYQKATGTGDMTIVIGVAPFAEGTEVEGTVSVLHYRGATNEAGTFTISTAGYLMYTPSDKFNDYTLIQIAPTSRMYISSIRLYDGVFSAAELGISPLNASPSSAAPRKVNTTKLTTTDNQYTFTNLVPSSRYEVVVRSVDDERNSLWSDIAEIVLDPASAILVPEASCDFVPVTGVFDLSGRRVADAKKGIYIRNGRKYIK